MKNRNLWTKIRAFSILVLLAGLISLSGTTATAAGVTHWVNDDDPNGGAYVPPGTSCNNPGYQRIQDAVNAATAGDTINVCPGTYPEQVVIETLAKSNLTLRSTSYRAAIIQAPPVMMDPGDIVRVRGARNVTIRDFKITGPLPDEQICSPFARTGIRVGGGGSALILNNHITEIRSASPALRYCQNGIGILVGRAFESEVGQAVILNNLIDKYQKGGIVVSNVGSSAEIAANRINGAGPTDVIAQNGIQISAGATAQVRLNQVSNHLFSPRTAVSTGLVLVAPGAVNTSLNFVSSNDVGVYSQGVAGSTFSRDRVTGSTFDGFALITSSSNTLDDNESNDNSGPGIGLYDAQDNTLNKNEVRNNGTDETTDGIYVDAASTNNQIVRNKALNNVEHDCHDDSVGAGTAGTANFWVNNTGQTENRPGLCRDARGGDEDDDGDDDDDDDDNDDGHGDSKRDGQRNSQRDNRPSPSDPLD